MNYDYIVFSDDWGRHPFSCQHLMTVILEEHRVLWVNTIGMRYPRFSLYDLIRIFDKIRSWTVPSPICELPENLTLLAPFMIPFNNIGWIRRLNKRSVVKTVLAEMQRKDIRPQVLLATVPNACDYVGEFGEELDVYYCVDEFSEWPGVAKELVAGMEISLLDKVDFVVAVSDRLVEAKKSRGPTYLLTHGVDVEHFQKARTAEMAEAVASLAGPRIGFFGLIDERTDQDLLESLLCRKPEWNLVLIGRSVVSLDKLKQYPNFTHIPPIDYAELPAYAAGFDVAIIPYVINELSKNINPLKLKEYLACGIPVVSTPLPEALRYADVVSVAESANFVDAVETALSQGGEGLPAVLEGESWRDKAGILSQWISTHLSQKRKA